MENADKVKANIRLLVFVVSLPFWALLVIDLYSLWLGDPYTFDVTHAQIVVAVYVFFRVVVQGKNPLGTAGSEKH